MATAQQNNIDNHHALVLGGGGAKRVAYSGALQALDLRKFDLVAGTSVGAVTAMLIALGVDKNHIRYLCEVDMSQLLSQNTVDLYQGNAAIAALSVMAQDTRHLGCNQSTVLRQLLLHEISSRLLHLYQYLYNRDKLASDMSWHNLAVVDTNKWLKAGNRVKGFKATLIRWIKSPQLFTFSDLASLRQWLFNCGLDAQIKRLLVTTTRLSDTMSACVMGTPGHCKMVYPGIVERQNATAPGYEIRVIDAVMASAAFPGVYSPVAMGPGRLDRFSDGGIFDHQPTHLGIRHLTDSERGCVVSLMLNKLDHRIEQRENRILGWAGQTLVNFANEGFKSQLHSVVSADELIKVDQANNASVKQFAQERLFELDLKLKGIDTLSLSVAPQTKEEVVRYANKVVRTELAHTTLLSA